MKDAAVRTTLGALFSVCAVFAALPHKTFAQATYTAQCASLGAQISNARADCERVGQAVDILEPRLGIATSGGNPVPGTASTLGMRIRSMPRITFGLRATSTLVDLPSFDNFDPDNNTKFAATSFDVDASAGVFSGLAIFPTIGGFGSVDVLGSAGVTALSHDKGFTGSPKTWGVGARVGILRESFTAPGISLSAMYRRTGDVSFGDSTLATNNGFFSLDGLSTWSYRAAIGKRIPIIGLGATAGVGIDRYSASSEIRVASQNIGLNNFRASDPHTKTSRKSAFVDASWTMLLLNLVGEFGWQEGGNADADATVSTAKIVKSGYFASLAARIAL